MQTLQQQIVCDPQALSIRLRSPIEAHRLLDGLRAARVVARANECLTAHKERRVPDIVYGAAIHATDTCRVVCTPLAYSTACQLLFDRYAACEVSEVV